MYTALSHYLAKVKSEKHSLHLEMESDRDYDCS